MDAKLTVVADDEEVDVPVVDRVMEYHGVPGPTQAKVHPLFQKRVEGGLQDVGVGVVQSRVDGENAWRMA